MSNLDDNARNQSSSEETDEQIRGNQATEAAESSRTTATEEETAAPAHGHVTDRVSKPPTQEPRVSGPSGPKHPGLTKVLQVLSAGFLLGLGLLLGYALSPASRGGTKTAKVKHARHGAKAARKARKAHKKQWTCSMHPQIRSDKPGKCPICGMDLVPVEDEAGSDAGKAASSHAGQGVEKPEVGEAAPAQAHKKQWTCSMHPQIRSDKPGKCPICGMDLVPVEDEGEQAAPGSTGGAHGAHGKAGAARAASAGKAAESKPPVRIRLSARARLLARVRTSVVESTPAKAQVELIGKVAVDERRLVRITSWVSGRIDRLYVDYRGTKVSRGRRMALLYSPQLVAAQAELFEAKRAAKALANSPTKYLRSTAQATVQAAREKLLLLGLSKSQLAEMEGRGKIQRHVVVRSPASGVVLRRIAQEGQYVQAGTPLYEVADLSRVWAILEAYETDVALLKKGDEVKFTVQALPARTFTGRVEFIDPVLDQRTRTIRIRLTVRNKSGQLRPGMLVRAKVAAKPLQEKGVLVPQTALLMTGKRALVYVEVPGQVGTYEPRIVHVGPKLGDKYLILHGLEPGERVVTNGEFRIDSTAQIRGLPSMLNPTGGRKTTGHNH